MTTIEIDTVKNQWKQPSGEVRQKSGFMTRENLKIADSIAQFFGKQRNKYGFVKEIAERVQGAWAYGMGDFFACADLNC